MPVCHRDTLILTFPHVPGHALPTRSIGSASRTDHPSENRPSVSIIEVRPSNVEGPGSWVSSSWPQQIKLVDFDGSTHPT